MTGKVIVEIQQDTDYRIHLKPTEPVILALMSDFTARLLTNARHFQDLEKLIAEQ